MDMKFPVSRVKAAEQPEFQAREVNYYDLSCFPKLTKDFSNQNDVTLDLHTVEDAAREIPKSVYSDNGSNLTAASVVEI